MLKELKTRSEYKPSPLDKLFETTDTDVGTFLDVISDRLEHHPDTASVSLARRLVSGAPDKVKAPKKLASCLSGFVRIFHGWHNKDYVWHIEHAAIRRPWKIPIERVIYIIAQIMHSSLPDVEAKIWPPVSDWELKTVTFKAIDLSDSWSFSEADIEKINNKLLETLNKFV